MLVPALLLGLLEAGLRLSGSGFSSAFFIRSNAEGKTTWISNEHFALPFFPPGLLRRPVPMTLEHPKPPGTCRIFIFGESAAMGDPDPAFGFGRMLEVLLRERFPGKRFEVVNTAFTAINSHAILPLARECAKLDGDFWIVYMGNNEMEGPFGAGALFGPRAPPLPLVRASLAISSTRTGQWLKEVGRKIRGVEAGSAGWQGLKMLAERPVFPGDPARSRVYRNFAGNLNDILRAGEQAGVPVILGTIASNLRDCSPFISRSGAAADAAQEETLRGVVSEARGLNESGRAGEVLSLLERHRSAGEFFADLHFQLAVSQLAEGRVDQARASFRHARDLDALPLRCDSTLNEQIRTTARSHSNAVLVDIENAFESGPQDIPGRDSFYEHVHLTFAGNFRIARLFADAIRDRFTGADRSSEKPEWVDQEHCAMALGWTAWSELASWEQMGRRIAGPPFTNQSTHLASIRALGEKASEVRSRMDAAALSSAMDVLKTASAGAPGDHYLAGNLARLLEAAGQLGESYQVWERVRTLMPQSPSASFELGRIALKLGRGPEAVEHFRSASLLRPESFEVALELSRALLAAGRLDDAVKEAGRAQALAPESSEVRLLLGLIHARAGQTNLALQHFVEASGRGSESARVSASLEAARLLGLAGKHDEAAVQYRRILSIQPAHSIARLNLAEVLAKAGKRSEATAVLREAIAVNPGNWEARYLLGVELAMLQQVKEAEAEFTEVILAKPDFTLAHLNLGVALAQQERLDEALARFQEVLRLDSKNEQAKNYVNLIGRMKNKNRN